MNTGVRGIATATTGATTGISSYVNSAAGTAAVFNNPAAGKIISGQNNGVEKFSVDGSGNVTPSGHFTGSGSGLTGITMSQLTGTLSSAQLSGTYSNALTFSNTGDSYYGNGSHLSGMTFSQLTGTLPSTQLSGTYSNALTLSNTGNTYYGNGAHLTGVVPGAGSTYYIQNGTTAQSASFNITGNATVSGTLQVNLVQGNAVNSVGPLQIGGLSALSLGGQFLDHNLFIAYDAGLANITGSGQYNTFAGTYAGQANTEGSQDTYVGFSSGANNTEGTDNTFIGYDAGAARSLASYNTFIGANSGQVTTNGQWNTFIGAQAGQGNTTGGGNLFIGAQAGEDNTTGSGNIYIGSLGSPTQENNTMRLGTNQTSLTYIAGIYNSLPGPDGLYVFVDQTGHLGAEGDYDSAMQQVQDMGNSSDRLMQLRPVAFSLKPGVFNDSRMRFGLVAAEVDKVFPELVAHKADGTPSAVRSQYLTPMLLNEVQKQYHTVQSQAQTIQAQQQKIDQLEQRLSKLEALLAGGAQN